jgi:hypothetical protein
MPTDLAIAFPLAEGDLKAMRGEAEYLRDMVISSERDLSPQFFIPISRSFAPRRPFYVPPPANFLPLLDSSQSELGVPEGEGEQPAVEEGELNEDEEDVKGPEARDVSAPWRNWLNSFDQHDEEEEEDEPVPTERLNALSGRTVASFNEKSLTECVSDLSRLEEGDSQLFRAETTGQSKRRQRYCCPLMMSKGGECKCTAFVAFSKRIEDGEERYVLISHQFLHTHPVQFRNIRASSCLTAGQVAEIQRLTRLGMTAGQIRLQMQLTCPSRVLYDARRPILRELRRDQAWQLRRSAEGWTRWTTSVLARRPIIPGGDPVFTGFYACQPRLLRHEMCFGTLTMDDTACTNAYHMPVSEITAIDANEITQIVAFAILQSASIPCIGDFLRWFRVQLNSGTRFPRAFMIDRSEAEIGAIEQEFP